MITLAPEVADANPDLLPFLTNIDLIDAGWRQVAREDTLAISASTSARA
jgi:hypothetical protein